MNDIGSLCGFAKRIFFDSASIRAPAICEARQLLECSHYKCKTPDPPDGIKVFIIIVSQGAAGRSQLSASSSAASVDRPKFHKSRSLWVCNVESPTHRRLSSAPPSKSWDRDFSKFYPTSSQPPPQQMRSRSFVLYDNPHLYLVTWITSRPKKDHRA